MSGPFQIGETVRRITSKRLFTVLGIRPNGLLEVTSDGMETAIEPELVERVEWPTLRQGCGNRRVTPDIQWKDRTGAGLIYGGSERCGILVPDQWAKTSLGDLEMARRWLGSGGSPAVFGNCAACSCPFRGNQHPDHRNALEDLAESNPESSGVQPDA